MSDIESIVAAGGGDGAKTGADATAAAKPRGRLSGLRGKAAGVAQAGEGAIGMWVCWWVCGFGYRWA